MHFNILNNEYVLHFRLLLIRHLLEIELDRFDTGPLCSTNTQFCHQLELHNPLVKILETVSQLYITTQLEVGSC